MIHGPNIPGSCAILLFTALDLASITSPIHNWPLFFLWLHPFILSGVISPLISSSILGTYRPGEFLFHYLTILLSHTVHGVLKSRILKWFAIPFSSGPHSPGVAGKFGLGVQNEAGQRLIEFCQENALVIANTLFQQHKRRLHTWTSPNGQHRNQIDYICNQRWRSSIQSAKTRPGADCGSDHELLIAEFRLKLKRVGIATRPFKYDLDQIPYEYTVEVRNRFKGLDLIDREPDELWMEVRDTVQETGIIPMKEKCKKAKWLSEEALKIAVKRREAKSKGEKERYSHLNAEFQRITRRRDKKAFLSDQWKETGK